MHLALSSRRTVLHATTHASKLVVRVGKLQLTIMQTTVSFIYVTKAKLSKKAEHLTNLKFDNKTFYARKKPANIHPTAAQEESRKE